MLRGGRLHALTRTAREDRIFSDSLILLANAVLLAGFGFVFWALAARIHTATTVGLFSGVASAVVMLATVASLGLPNTLLRHLRHAPQPRALLAAGLAAVLALGSALCVAAVTVLGPHLPTDLQLDRPAGGVGLLVALVAVTAANAVTDAGLIAVSASRAVLVKNLAGSVVKLGAIGPLAGLETNGLVLAFGLGTVVSAVLGALMLWRRLQHTSRRPHPLEMLRRYLPFSFGNYAGVVMGIIPLTVVPLIVLAVRGPREAAWFAVAYLIVGFVNFIPSATSQVLFAELSRSGRPLREQLLTALAGVYALLLPAAVVLLAAAPLILELFGPDYSDGAATCLRLLALGTLFTGGTYLVDVLLAATDRVRAYAFMNGLNAVLVVAAVSLLVPDGLTAVGLGWMLAQAVSLLAGLLLVAATGVLDPGEPRSAQAPARG